MTVFERIKRIVRCSKLRWPDSSSEFRTGLQLNEYAIDPERRRRMLSSSEPPLEKPWVAWWAGVHVGGDTPEEAVAALEEAVFGKLRGSLGDAVNESKARTLDLVTLRDELQAAMTSESPSPEKP